MAELNFDTIYQEIRGSMHPGKLRLLSKELMFRNEKTGRIDHFNANDIVKTEWLLRARGYCLRIILQNGNIYRYDGFSETDYDALAGYLSREYNVQLTKRDLSYKGWNWGNAVFEGNAMRFDIGSNTAFEIPLNNVSNTQKGKSEVVLQFHQNDEADVCLTEMRFHIPDGENENAQVEELYNNVMKKADIIQVTGDSIVEFKEIQVLQPRGRYDLKLYSTFFHMHGKTFDYKIPLNTIVRMFLLPHKDHNQMFFLINIDPPVKHGQTRYHFVICLFDKETEVDAEINGTEEEIEQKYEGKLQKTMSGVEYQVVARVFKVLANCKVSVPGNFKSKNDDSCVSCTHKTSTGFLYPLERGFIYVYKPPVHIRFDEISYVKFSRGSVSARSFDFEIETKNRLTFTFSSIEKDEYHKLFDFVANKNLVVKNVESENDHAATVMDNWSSSDESHDAYMERVKKEGKRGHDFSAGDLDDSDDEDDEDFRPPESVSEVDEEYDSNISVSSASSDDDYSGEGSGSERPAKKSKPKKPKKEKKAKKEKKTPTASKKRRTVTKDKNAPKRPPSMYMLWMNENRDALAKMAGEGASVTDIAKLGGEEWKKISDEEREKYKKLADEKKAEYEVVMAEYQRKLDAGEIEANYETKKQTTSSSKSKPKKSDESAAGRKSGGDFKSAEYVESSGGSSSSDISDDSGDDDDDKEEESNQAPSKSMEEGDNSDAEEESD